MKRTVSLILLIIFGCLFGLLLFEAVAYLPLKKTKDTRRILLRHVQRGLYGMQHDRLLGWKGVSDTEGSFNQPEFKTYVSLNSRGFRDKEHSNLTNTDTYKIVVSGDSFVWGYGVEQKDRFTDMLESLLKSEGIKSVVINMGVPAYGTDQEYLLFQSEGIRYNPKLVILAIYSDDFDSNSSTLWWSVLPKPAFRYTKAGTLKLTNVPVPPPKSTKFWLMSHSSIYSLYVILLAKSNLFRNLCIKVGLAEDKEHIKQQAIPLTKELLRNFFNLVKQSNSEFLAVLIPDHYKMENTQRNGDFTAIASFIKNELQSNVLDLRPLLSKDIGKYYFKVDPHWTAEGHRLAGEAIFNYLAENRFLSQNRSIAK